MWGKRQTLFFTKTQRRYNKSFLSYNDAKKSQLTKQLKRDQKKETFCELNQIKLVTIYEKDIIDEHLFESQGVIL